MLLLGPVLGDPTGRLLGAWDSEGPGHLLPLALSLREPALWTIAPVPGLPSAIPANIAPLGTLVALPFHALEGGGLGGVALGWNAIWACAAIAGPLGAWLYVREREDPSAAAAAACIVAFSAYLHGSPAVGRLEELAAFGWPLHLALLHRATVTRRSLGWAIGAAASFALLAMQGGFVAVFLGMVEPFAALGCLAASPDRRRACVVFAAVAVAGAVAVAPFLLAHLADPPPPLVQGHRGRVIVGIAQLLPGEGVPFARGYHVRPYPGWVVAGVALLAAIRHRRARPWLLAAVVSLVLVVPGPALHWTPDSAALVPLPPSLVPLPATGWGRFGVFVPFFLAFAAAPIFAGRPVAAIVVSVLAAAEQLSVVPRPEAWDLRPPDALAAELELGAVLHAPADARAILWTHMGSGRWPMEEQRSNRLLRWLSVAAPGEPTAFRPRASAAEAVTPGCVATSAAELAGWRALAVRAADPLVTASLEGGLGPPRVATPDVSVWDLVPAVAPEPCPPEERPKRRSRGGGGRRR